MEVRMRKAEKKENLRFQISAQPLAASFQLNQEKNYIFVINDVVSYERRRWPPASSQIEKRNSEKRIMNIEQGITNIEVRYSIIIIFEKRLSVAISHFIIRNFLFDILRFAVPTVCFI